LDLTWLHFLIAIGGGLVAGVINTLAGNGSAITLTIFTELLGLPPNMANGTNRVGIAAQGVVSTYVFQKNGKLKIKNSWFYIVLIFIGAMLGVYVALQVSNEQFKTVFSYLLVVMLVVILIKPKRWLRDTDTDFKLHPIAAAALMIPLGFYGGFIQMGMGVLFLIVFVLIARYNIMEANAVKIFVVFLYTIVVLGIFAYKGMIDWRMGGLVAIGQAAGGWLGAEFGSKYKDADKWAYRLLVAIVLWAIWRLFDIGEFLLNIFNL